MTPESQDLNPDGTDGRAEDPSHTESPTESRRLSRAACALVVIAVGLGLMGLVATTTLPYALARDWPDLALRLNPKNPEALLTKADAVRAQYLSLLAPPEGQDQNSERTTAPNGEVGRFSAPITAEDRTASLESLRAKIQAFAQRVLEHDPFNAKAFRLLGEIASSPDEVRRYMKAAVNLSRREAIAAFWLLQDSISQDETDAALKYADILLRTEPQLRRYVVSYIAQINQDDGGRQALAKKLSENPPWRGVLFAALPRVTRDPATLLRLMLALKEAGAPPSNAEQQRFIAELQRANLHRFAYNVWLQLLAPDDLKAVRRLNNGDFERPPSGLPYDWRLARNTRNAVIEITTDPEASANKGLAVRLTGRRARNVQATQVMVIAPGFYKVRGVMRGEISAKRGLRWTVTCLGRKRATIGQSEMLFKTDAGWRPFEFVIEVPSDADCQAQQVTLSHDARSASEELASGALWFDNVQVDRIDAPAQRAER